MTLKLGRKRLECRGRVKSVSVSSSWRYGARLEIFAQAGLHLVHAEIDFSLEVLLGGHGWYARVFG